MLTLTLTLTLTLPVPHPVADAAHDLRHTLNVVEARVTIPQLHIGVGEDPGLEFLSNALVEDHMLAIQQEGGLLVTVAVLTGVKL